MCIGENVVKIPKGLAVALLTLLALLIGFGAGYQGKTPTTVTYTSLITSIATETATVIESVTQTIVSPHTITQVSLSPTTVRETYTSIVTYTKPVTHVIPYTMLQLYRVTTTATYVKLLTYTYTFTPTIQYTATTPTIVIGVGEATEVGGFRIAVLGYNISKYVYEEYTWGKDYYTSRYPNYVIVKATLYIENVGKEVLWLSRISNFRIVTKSGIELEDISTLDLKWLSSSEVTEEIKSKAIPIKPLSLSDELWPKTYVVGDILFQIPEDEEPAKIIFTVRTKVFDETEIVVNLTKRIYSFLAMYPTTQPSRNTSAMAVTLYSNDVEASVTVFVTCTSRVTVAGEAMYTVVGVST